MKTDRAGWLAIPILALFAVIPVRAQEQNNPGVARVSFIHGDVTMQRGDSGDFSSITLNTPLMAGDKVATGAASRTELQLDYANILRLDENAQASIAMLDRARIQVQIGQGLAHYSVLKGSQADVEIDTPNVSIHPLREGRYRIQVDPDGDTLVTVNDGEAQVSTPEGNTTVKRYQLITIRGTGADAQYRVTEAPNSDDWDKWNRDRDNIIYNANAYRRTNRYYTGAGDLDAYGTWTEVPDYGPVWIPQVDYGWAPYRAGRWVWEPYWGWTWVSYEPWGWAPYHYGRWFLWGGSWAWWPGPIYPDYRPIWAPAYVSFFGFGGGFGFNVGFGFGSIGWLPIGPCDFFHPWWGGFRDRFGAVNVTNITINNFNGGIAPLHAGSQFSNLRSMLINDRIRAGVSGVAAESFGRGTTVARSVAVSQLRTGRMMTGNLPVVPGRDSLRVSERPVSPAVSSRMATQRSFFTKSAPAVRPEPFSAQAEHVNQAIQRSGQFQAINPSRGAETAGSNRAGFRSQSNLRQQPAAVPPQANTGAGARNPVQSETRGGRTLEGQTQARQSAPTANGWQRFGGERGTGGAQAPQIRSNTQPEFRNNAPSTREATQSPVTRPQIRSNPQPEFRSNAPTGREAQGASGSSGWQRFSRSDRPVTLPSNGGFSSPGSRRPTLDMNKPIVNERSYRGNSDGYAGANRGGSAPAYRPAPSYSAPRAPSYSAPRYSAPSPSYRSYPSNPAPSYRSAPAPRSYGSGSYGGYRGGGGGSFGGGGSRGGSSGGHSSGGYSRGR
jgi:uncharacterized protein DUF6600/FecR-like protein